METRPYVPWDLMNSFMIDVFKAYGVPENDAGALRAMAATASSPFT